MNVLAREHAAAAPRTLDGALNVAQKATQEVGVGMGFLREHSANHMLFHNAGGVTTTIRSTGEIIIERAGQVIQHLKP